jgi:hypothetical protein
MKAYLEFKSSVKHLRTPKWVSSTKNAFDIIVTSGIIKMEVDYRLG